jgi:glutamine synthetase
MLPRTAASSGERKSAMTWETLEQPEREARAAHAGRIAADLAERGGVEAVAVTWVDNSGITRVKSVPLARLAHAAAWGIGASGCFDTFLLDDSAAVSEYAGGPVGDLRLHPDLDRLTVLAGLPGFAWAPADRYRQDGGVHPIDQRSLLRREVARLREQGYSVRAAFEVEWCVSQGPDDDFDPPNVPQAYGMARLTDRGDYVRDLFEAFAAQGVAVDQIHPEYPPGQFEISVAAEDPVGAADTDVLVRETIRAVSDRHGLRVTFAPKVVAGSVGNGGHVHLSLWREEWEGETSRLRNAMSGGEGRYGLTAEGEAFAGGILAHLPALLALGAPSAGSYLRLIPSYWAGAYACWGLENREAALRFVAGARGDGAGAANLEVKCFDASANPYLALAGLLAAGRAGLAARAALPEPVDVDPASLPADERERRGIRALPSQLEQAVAAWEADPVFTEAFGFEFTATIAAVRRGEVKLFDGASDEEVVERSRWRY